MKQWIKYIVVSWLLLTLLVFTFGLGMIFGNSSSFLQPGVVRAEDQPEEFEVFWQVWNLVNTHYIDREMLTPQGLTYGAIQGVIDALGDEGHSRFLTPDEAARQRTDITGTFSGIGARVGIRDDLPVIVAPFDGSPADRAGVKAGDIIIEVDGEDVTALSLDDVVERIRGEAGTEVVLTIFRPDADESLEIPIIRGEIDIPVVSWAMVPGTDVADIRLSQFTGNLHENLLQAISEAKAAGAKSLIIDVRNNPGGLLEQAITVTGEFIDGGVVVLQEDAEGNRHPFEAEEGGSVTEIPLVVLVNRGSASASEIFAGAIQDHERGQVVGETTFGTGTVLRPFRLNDGSTLLLGTSQWLTPEGRLIRKQGIEPDHIVEIPIGSELLSPARLEEIEPEELADSEDAQFLKALELLDALPQTSTPPPSEEE